MNKEFGTPETILVRRQNILDGRVDLHTVVSKGGIDPVELIEWAIEKEFSPDSHDNPGEQLDEAGRYLNRIRIY